jgi:uncharacterized protein YjbI with pentapeptide repeats
MLRRTHLEGADLSYAHLEGASLGEAHFEGASLWGARLERADLSGAHLEGAYLWEARGLSPAQLAEAHGDAATRLPRGLAWPAHWPAPAAVAPPSGTA